MSETKKKLNSKPIRGRKKSAVKREQIVAAADLLFSQHGYDGTSMDKVAEQAGVSKQTVYSHFANKDALYGESIARKCAEYGIAPEAIDDEAPCAVTLAKIASHFIALILSDEATRMYRMTMGDAAQHPAVARLFYAAGPRRAIDLVAGYIAGQQRRGRLGGGDAYFAACQFLSMLQSDAWQRTVLNVEQHRADEDAVRRYGRSCVDAFLRAYAPPD